MIYRSDDQKTYNDLMASAQHNWGTVKKIGELMLNVGKYFLGLPYIANTLETGGEETLVINLREFDCFTFVENVVVLARQIREGKVTFEEYGAALEKIRYRKGALKGYPSRLHYFSDWLRDNKEKGIVKDVTAEIGGKPILKEINFMTTHRADYPGLDDDQAYRKMGAVEKSLSGRTMYHIPKAELKQSENAIIEDGDIIAAATSIEGLDVSHVGLAVSVRGRVHLLHASEAVKKVVISDDTLYLYLSKHKTMTGIMIGRVG
ncbi:MAG TPA: N-acetylmuramoyl-L-alanine amidase-like domain-containing protein [Syntrophales bacterium]|nr:N-acetylmuramoyl-L-alanine amidase-like domain-containing protein [Syntrophales bacterium]